MTFRYPSSQWLSWLGNELHEGAMVVGKIFLREQMSVLNCCCCCGGGGGGVCVCVYICVCVSQMYMCVC